MGGQGQGQGQGQTPRGRRGWGEGVVFGDGWIEARPTYTSAPAPKRRHTHRHAHAPTDRHAPAVRQPCAGTSGDIQSLENETETGQATYARRRICRHTRCGVPDPDRLVTRSGHDVVPVGRDGDRRDPV